MTRVTVYSRIGCHLCESAIAEIKKFEAEFTFELEEIFIDGNNELVKKYGEEVPVILINGNPHDFFRVDPDRFKKAMKKESHPHQ